MLLSAAFFSGASGQAVGHFMACGYLLKAIHSRRTQFDTKEAGPKEAKGLPFLVSFVSLGCLFWTCVSPIWGSLVGEVVVAGTGFPAIGSRFVKCVLPCMAGSGNSNPVLLGLGSGVLLAFQSCKCHNSASGRCDLYSQAEVDPDRQPAIQPVPFRSSISNNLSRSWHSQARPGRHG